MPVIVKVAGALLVVVAVAAAVKVKLQLAPAVSVVFKQLWEFATVKPDPLLTVGVPIEVAVLESLSMVMVSLPAATKSIAPVLNTKAAEEMVTAS